MNSYRDFDTCQHSPQFQYTRRVQVDSTHSQKILEFNSVLITLALTLLLAVGTNVLAVIGDGWMTLTLWRLHLHSSSDLMNFPKSTLTLTLTLLIVFEIHM